MIPTLETLERSLETHFGTPIPPGLFRRFRTFFAFKISIFALLFAADFWSPANISTLFVLLVASSCVISRQRYWPGVLVLFAYKLCLLIATFPYTINHHYLETFILLALLLFPAPEPSKRPSDTSAGVDGLCCHLIQFTFLLVIFYSGVQKVFHGRYLNGEMFGFYALFERHPLATSQRWIFDVHEAIFGSHFDLPYTWHGVPGTIELHIPQWAVLWFIASSWLTVMGECLLPILIAFRRTRKFALVGLFVVLAVIAITSQEIAFAFTAFACLLLFLPQISFWSYPLLFIIELIYGSCILAGFL